MQVKQSNVKFSISAVKFFQKKVAYQKTTHKEKCVNRNRAISNTLEPPGHSILFAHVDVMSEEQKIFPCVTNDNPKSRKYSHSMKTTKISSSSIDFHR